MIGSIAQDLLTKVKTVTAFGTTPVRVGLAVGGKGIDPTMEKVILPASWVIYTGDTNIDTSNQGECGPNIRMEFIVKILVSYGTESDLITNQFTLLENVINAVNGKAGPVGTKKWKYEGQTIDELTDKRLVFDQRYSIITFL